MKKLILAALLFGLSGQAMATDWFIYPNPPLFSVGSGNKFINRKAALLAQHDGCIVDGNLFKRFALYKQSGLTESEAITQNEQQYPLPPNMPQGLSKPELHALGAIYQGHQFAGLTPDQVRAKKIRDCIRAHPVPAGSDTPD